MEQDNLKDLFKRIVEEPQIFPNFYIRLNNLNTFRWFFFFDKTFKLM